MTCRPYSMHVLHPLGWYMMERFSFHIHAWLSSRLSSTSIGECSRHPPLLGEPFGSSSSLGWPMWSSSSPSFGASCSSCCGVVSFFCWWRWWWLLESGSLFFSTPFHHHFGPVPWFLRFWLLLSSWRHCHSFWQILPSLDITQHQVIIEGLQLIAVGYRLPCGIP